MTDFRRGALVNISAFSDTHAGLWLDKYLKDDNKGGDEESAKSILVDEVATKIRQPDSYPDFFTRWQKSLDAIGAQCREAKTMGRLAVNLGAEGVLETSIALHRTYGIPYIPGSALKGLAAHYVIKYQDKTDWGRESKAFKALFGDTSTAGYVNFYDALYVPDSGHNRKALWADIITVHHPDYYQSGNTPPADWDSPTPIPFLTATGKFLIALSGPDKWVNAAFEILELALAREGIGAKTSSGYGRMQFAGTSARQEPEETYAIKKKRILETVPEPGRFRGTVANLVSDRHGFINPAKGGSSLLVHVSQMKLANSVLRVGQVLDYRIGKNDKGINQAQDVIVLLEPDK